MKKIGRILVLTGMLLFSFTGCGHRVELNDRALVQGIGVDMNSNGGYTLTTLIFEPAPGSESYQAGQGNSKVAKGEGTTLTEAMDKISSQIGKRIFLGSSQFIMIGQQAAKKGILPILEYFNNDPEFRFTSAVLVSLQSAETTLQVKEERSVSPEQIERMLDTGKKRGEYVKGELLDIMQTLVTKGISPAVVLVERQEGEDGTDELVLGGTAVFKGDQMVDILDTAETRGLIWTQGDLRDISIQVEHPDVGKAALQLLKSKPKISVASINGIPQFLIHIELHCIIAETSSHTQGGIGLNQIPLLEQQAARLVVQEVEATLEKTLKKDKSDLYHFAPYLRKYQNRYWKEHIDAWEEELGNLNYRVEVTCAIDRVGKEIRENMG